MRQMKTEGKKMTEDESQQRADFESTSMFD